MIIKEIIMRATFVVGCAEASAINVRVVQILGKMMIGIFSDCKMTHFCINIGMAREIIIQEATVLPLSVLNGAT